MNKNIYFMENENAFKVLSRAQKLEKQGEKIINLGIGQPDLNPPKYVIEEAINAIKNENHGYTNAKGILKLRETISNEYQSLYNQKIEPDNIIVSPGAKPIIYMAISMLSDYNSEILLSNPSFPIYASIIKYCGAKPVFSDIDKETINICPNKLEDTIKKNPNSSLLFYGKKEKIQLRMKVESKLHYKDEIAKESWDKTGHISRKCYLVTNGPGTKSEKPTSGLDNKFDNFDFTKEESEAGYKNFCVIKCKIKSIEWLYLAAKGHRRALIEFEGSKKFSWLIP